MIKMKKVLALGMSLVLAGGMLAGCGKKKADSNTIKIGGIAPLTGKVSVYGKATEEGYKLAIKQYNEKGGVLGKKIELKVYDDKGDNNEAINAYNKLVNNDGVDGIIGAVISSNALAIAPKAAKDGIPMITPTGTAGEITEAGNNIFRSCFTDPYQGGKIAKYATEDLKAKTAAIMYDPGNDYGVGLAKAFKETFEKSGGKVVADEGYTANDKDYKSILTKVKGKNADVLFVPDYYNTVALIGKQAKEVGIQSTLLGGDGWDGVVGIDKESVEGGYFSNHYAVNDPNPVVKDFVEAYKKEYNGKLPNAFAALGYDAGVTLLEAIKKAGTTDSKKVVEALKNTDLELVSGKTKFDENRNPIKPVSVIKVVNGQYELAGKK
ncbi:ABC transporter branched-chain amino acid-binding protein LivK [Gottschalkia purinilytica]|uniref:ABC transporter branched-chain amino acid-binding protein LivK n=1 Tax=Gottschalkia purinilytica TaxID=1503 RepID=A0A0L0WEY1_GOTPU|nr:ABC transporter substrate-binding protein [Gottschalkia purinilytica]KNF10029.1 ABC transporter branched-chain amino acid-binding protein LivK [Gottschalkia purinilytica]